MSVLTLNAKLDRTDSSTPWGFRMQGGKDFNGPLQIQRVNPGSLADRCGVKANDTIIKIGNVSADGLRHKEAQNAIVSCGNNLELTLQRSGGGGGGGATPYMPYQAAYNTPQNYSSPGGSQPPTNQLQNMNISSPGAGPPQQGYKPVAPAAAPSYAPRPAASAPPPWAGSSPAAPAAPKPASAGPPARPPAGGGGGKTKFGRVGDAKVHQEGGMAGRIPTCTGCGTTIREIRGPFVQALGKTWCPNHFVCGNAGCGNSLVDIGFVEEEGKLYCERDYEKYFAPRCHKCSSAVMGECVTAMAQQYHPHCFLCAHCRQPIGSGGFHIEEGQPYCLKDWGELFQTKCMGCEFAIEPGDRWVEALGGNWHSECFNCSQCQVNLEGQSFYAKGGKPYCKRHAGGF